MHFNDNESEDFNSPNSTPQTQESKPKSKKKSFLPKFLMVSTSLVVLMIAGIVASVFIPVGAQTLASRALDSAGLHNFALGAEGIAKSNGNLLTYYSSIDPKNPQSCGNNWKSATKYISGMNQVSGSLYSQAYFNNPEYKDDFNFESYISGVLDLENVQTQGEVDLSAKANLDLIEEIVKEYEAGDSVSQLEGMFSLDAKFVSIIDLEKLALKVPEIKLQVDEKFAGVSSNDWYGQDFELEDIQKEGAKDISTEIRGALKDFNPEQNVSEETWKTVFTESCKLIEKVEVQSPETKTFGPEGKTVTKEVRPIKVTFVDNSIVKQQESGKIILETVQKDEKLKAYLKSLYPRYKNIAIASEKINKTYSPGKNYDQAYPQGDFEKAIDDYFASLSEQAKYLESLNGTENPLFDLEAQGLKIQQTSYFYLNQENLDFYAFENQIEYLFEDKFFSSEFGSEIKGTLKDLISQGVMFKVIGYGTEYNENAKKVEEVNSFKPIEDFVEDNQKQFEDTVSELNPSSSSSSSEPSSFDFEDDFEIETNPNFSSKSPSIPS
jgi:hypothetical protein